MEFKCEMISCSNAESKRTAYRFNIKENKMEYTYKDLENLPFEMQIVIIEGAKK